MVVDLPSVQNILDKPLANEAQQERLAHSHSQPCLGENVQMIIISTFLVDTASGSVSVQTTRKFSRAHSLLGLCNEVLDISASGALGTQILTPLNPTLTTTIGQFHPTPGPFKEPT